MANAVKGEVPFVLDEKPYVLSLSINALCELETLTKAPALHVMATLTNPAAFRYTDLRAVLWGALRDHHKNITVEQAGEMIDRLGKDDKGAHVAHVLLLDVIKLTYPDPPNQGEGTSGPLAEQSQSAGTGNAS